MSVNTTRLAVVIVTFNRRDDLEITLRHLLALESGYKHLIVINNASTDSTVELLEAVAPEFNGKLDFTTLSENTGGAGGFHEGIKIASNLDVDWIWSSDDDAIPQPGCFEEILKAADCTDNIYGSTAITKDSPEKTLCWPVSTMHPGTLRSSKLIEFWDELATTQEVGLIPFLGLMISKEKVQEIGLPNKSYFISGDDHEYCIRAMASGSTLVTVKDSIVHHPEIPRYTVSFFTRRFWCLRMPPWRRYWDVRNRIWNSYLMKGRIGALVTSASLVLRLIFSLVLEKQPLAQIQAYFRGAIDGLFKYHQSGNPSGLFSSLTKLQD